MFPRLHPHPRRKVYCDAHAHHAWEYESCTVSFCCNASGLQVSPRRSRYAIEVGEERITSNRSTYVGDGDSRVGRRYQLDGVDVEHGQDFRRAQRCWGFPSGAWGSRVDQKE